MLQVLPSLYRPNKEGEPELPIHADPEIREVDTSVMWIKDTKPREEKWMEDYQTKCFFPFQVLRPITIEYPMTKNK